jgi:hypothetical protein
MKKFKILSALFLISFVSVLISSVFFAGCETETETKKEQAPVTEMEKPRVEGLEEFHEVLYVVWHSYLPDGDYQSIRETMPEFKKTLEILISAEVPEFYQHVKDDFEKKRQNLALAVENLDSVAQTGDDKKLESALENMHSAFEQMARVLAPRIKEIEEFHLVLYPLWHYAMPDKDYQAIKAAIPTLESRMDALMKAQFPERLKDSETQFIGKREALRKAVGDLTNVCRQNKDDEIIDKLIRMHECYRDLDEVFE